MRQLGLFEFLRTTFAGTSSAATPPSRDGGASPRVGGDPPHINTRPDRPQSASPRGTERPPIRPPRPHTPPAGPPPSPKTATGSDIEFVRNNRAKRYLIRVRTDGSVRVTIPRRGSRREADAFLQQNRAWVAAQQQRVAELRARLPQDLSADEQKRLRARAARELPVRLHELAAPLGLTVRKVSVRNQRQRWGACSTSGLITLNWRLITMPDWVRDYVIYHELMHLKRMDHSPAFWRLVAAVCPDYRKARAWLRRHALAPHAATDDEVDGPDATV